MKTRQSQDSTNDRLPDELCIVAKTDEYIVTIKPAGLATHAEGGPKCDNVVDLIEKQQNLKLHPLNRLDKEASGLMILVAPEVTKKYQDLWADLRTLKYYSAVTHGVCKSRTASSPQKILWSWPLSDKSEGHKNPQGISAQRKACSTEVEILKSTQYLSLIRCHLITGRQHQIRKHAALNGTALVGDSRYGEKKKCEQAERFYGFKGLALHCSEIHLCTGEVFKCELPERFKLLIDDRAI